MTLDVKNEKLCEMVETPEKQSQDSCLGTAKMTVQMGFHSSCTDVTKSTFFFFFYLGKGSGHMWQSCHKQQLLHERSCSGVMPLLFALWSTQTSFLEWQKNVSLGA